MTGFGARLTVRMAMAFLGAVLASGCGGRPDLRADLSVGAGGSAQVDAATISMGPFAVRVKP